MTVDELFYLISNNHMPLNNFPYVTHDVYDMNFMIIFLAKLVVLFFVGK